MKYNIDLGILRIKIRIVNMKIDQKINILFCTSKIHQFKIKIASFVLLKYILNARFH